MFIVRLYELGFELVALWRRDDVRDARRAAGDEGAAQYESVDPAGQLFVLFKGY
jgi:hypothetical protein